MSGTYFIVNHVSDADKTDGLVEGYQMLPVQYEGENGETVTGFRRVNFVHWPNIPNPFVHEEWSEDLVFSSIYNALEDTGEDEDEDEYDDEEDDASFDSEEGTTEAEA